MRSRQRGRRCRFCAPSGEVASNRRVGETASRGTGVVLFFFEARGNGMPRPPLPDVDARRIVLIKPTALGDVVHALPVLTALRRRYPGAHIAWVVNRAYEPLLRGHRDLNETIPFDRGASSGGWWRAARAHAGFLRQLRRGAFDL